jgi:hypothetical protein
MARSRQPFRGRRGIFRYSPAGHPVSTEGGAQRSQGTRVRTRYPGFRVLMRERGCSSSMSSSSCCAPGDSLRAAASSATCRCRSVSNRSTEVCLTSRHFNARQDRPPVGFRFSRLNLGPSSRRCIPASSSSIYAVTELNGTVYQVAADGTCTAFLAFDPQRHGIPNGLQFTRDGATMLVSIGKGDVESGAAMARGARSSWNRVDDRKRTSAFDSRRRRAREDLAVGAALLRQQAGVVVAPSDPQRGPMAR